jgi:CelD/BcsL family acetyltransferase involved in cellulose biosynthesis
VSPIEPRTTGPARWTEKSRELRFTFGEFRLWTANFRAWVLEKHYLDCGPEDLAGLPPFAEVPSGIQVLVLPSHPVAAELPALTRLPAALRYVPAHFNHYCIELPGSLEAYLAGLSGKSRHEMARKVRRFTEHAAGRQELRAFREVGEMAEFVRLAGSLSRMTYQGRLLAVGLPEGPAFVAELEAAAARDEVRGYLLLLDGRPVAYGYCRVAGDVLLFEHTGYDPALAEHSPGIFLLREMLSRIFAECRFRVFDFGTGDAQYKKSYATSCRRCATVLQFRPTLKNALVVRAHRALIGFSDGCVRLLKTLGIKDRVRRLLRRGGSSRAGKADASAS